MDLIPNGFLKLPDLEYIHETPSDPYTFPTSGVIHSSKFKVIYEELLQDNMPDIDTILQGHVLHQSLSNLLPKELADFCRHVIHINRDFIGWQESDALLAKIDDQFTATWQLPDFIFTADFSNTLSTIIRWDPRDVAATALEEIAKTGEISYPSPPLILDKLNSNYPFWTVRDLWFLYDWVIEKTLEKDQSKSSYIRLRDVLTALFLAQSKKNAHELTKRVIIVSLLTRSYGKLSDKTLFENQDILDRMWQEIEHNLPSHKVLSYRYLYAINYARIGVQYYQHNIDFVTKRQLVNKILTSFISTDELDFSEWLDYFSKSDYSPNLLEFIVSGFSTIAELLRLHMLELPPSSLHEELQTLSMGLLETIFSVVGTYFGNRADDSNINPKNISQIIQLISEKNEETKAHKSMANILLRTYAVLLYQTEEFDTRGKYLDMFGEISITLYGESRARLYIDHLKILRGLYPFKEYYQTILKEVGDDGSIITSPTFESEVIKVISQRMDGLLTNYKKTGLVLFQELEELFYFSCQWLVYFSDEKEMYQDIIMILSPILSISLVQMIQGYYEKQMVHKAFLTYLTMQHAISYIRQQMQLVGDETRPRTGSFMIQDYHDMISEWQKSEILDIDTIKSKVKTIELTFSSHMDAMAGIIEDDIIMGYLELTTNLESFMREIYIEDNSIVESTELLYESPNPNGLNLFEHIGLVSGQVMPLRIPLIRNITKYALSLSLIPLDEELIELMQEDLRTADFLDLLVLQ